MKHTTKRYLGIAAVSALVIGTASGVFAHGGFGPGSGPGWGMQNGMMGSPGWGQHNRMMGGPGNGPGWGQHHGMMGTPGAGPGWMMNDDPAAYTDRQLTELKDQLGITADQNEAWDAYADAVKGRTGLMLSHRQVMTQSGTIAPEQRFAFHQQGLEQMQKINTASQDLYTALTPDQKAKAGNQFGMHHNF